eukprot:gene1598-4714_t
MCADQQPWEVDSTLAYGFAASNVDCGVCYEMEFTSTALAQKGKRMVLQVTNKGGDLGSMHFDIQLPGGGFGIFNGCAGSSCPNGRCQFDEAVVWPAAAGAAHATNGRAPGAGRTR